MGVFDYLLEGGLTPYETFLDTYRKSPHTQEPAIRRLRTFLDFAGILHIQHYTKLSKSADLAYRCNKFVELARLDKKWGITIVTKYLNHLFERIENREITSGSAKNNRAVVKRICEIGNIAPDVLNWNQIAKRYPQPARYSNDVAYSTAQINQLCIYGDPRIKPIVYVMATSGIRRGAWDGLKWKHVIPYEDENGDIRCAILIVYHGTDSEYPTLITKEAYDELVIWMDSRKKAGEKVGEESPLMRDIWDMDKDASVVKPLASRGGVGSLMRRALQKQGLRFKLTQGEKRHKFKMNHGLRKWHNTALRSVRDPQIIFEDINILTGHGNKGTIDNYYRPWVDGQNKLDGHLVKEYLRAEEFLTIDPRNMKTDKLEAKITANLESKYELQKKEYRKEILLMKFDNAIDKLLEKLSDEQNLKAKQIAKENGGTLVDEIEGIRLLPQQQLEYFFTTNEGKRLKPEEISLLKDCVASGEIKKVSITGIDPYEYNKSEEQDENKLIDENTGLPFLKF